MQMSMREGAADFGRALVMDIIDVSSSLLPTRKYRSTLVKRCCILLNFETLGIANGIVGPLNQIQAYAEYATSDPYKTLANSSIIASSNSSFYYQGGCRDHLTEQTRNAPKDFCEINVYEIFAARIFDTYDVRGPIRDPCPPHISPLLKNQAFIAKSNWLESSGEVYKNLLSTGDDMRNLAPDLLAVINAGCTYKNCRGIMISDTQPDLELICKLEPYFTMMMQASSVTTRESKRLVNLNTQYTSTYAQQKFSDYTGLGNSAGLVKNAGDFSYLRVFGAGHEVPTYNYTSFAVGQIQVALALQVFGQAMKGEPLTST
ncbi:hypothetical protein ACEPAI_7499 [Sanghuangporus weigelae]